MYCTYNTSTIMLLHFPSKPTSHLHQYIYYDSGAFADTTTFFL